MDRPRLGDIGALHQEPARRSFHRITISTGGIDEQSEGTFSG